MTAHERSAGAAPLGRDELAEAIWEAGVKQTKTQAKDAADSILAEIRIARARPSESTDR